MSDLKKEQERLNRFFSAGLTDEQLRLLGQITVIWNKNEFLLKRLIARAAKWPTDVGELITIDLPSVTLETLAKNVIQKLTPDGEWKSYALAAVEFYSEARTTRNNIIHSLPKLSFELRASNKAHKHSAKAGSGKIKITEYDISVPALEELVKTLMDVELVLKTAEVRLRDFISPPDDDMPVTLIDIKKIRATVDRLRSRRHTQDKR